jgi:hypothetical protein
MIGPSPSPKTWKAMTRMPNDGTARPTFEMLMARLPNRPK